MDSILATIISIFIFALILVYLIIFFILLALGKTKKMAIRLSADLSTIFFILSIYFLIKEIWGVSLHFFIILFMVLFILMFIWRYWKRHHSFHFPKIIKYSWRSFFIVSLVSHLLLLVVGVLTNAFIH